jgi:hypothetical protein
MLMSYGNITKTIKFLNNSACFEKGKISVRGQTTSNNSGIHNKFIPRIRNEKCISADASGLRACRSTAYLNTKPLNPQRGRGLPLPYASPWSPLGVLFASWKSSSPLGSVKIAWTSVSVCHLGAILGHLGPSWTYLRPSWPYLGLVMALSWAILASETFQTIDAS